VDFILFLGLKKQQQHLPSRGQERAHSGGSEAAIGGFIQRGSQRPWIGYHLDWARY